MSLLRAAAGQAGCEAVLTLADVRTTHSAFAADEGYGYQDWYDEYDESDDEYTGGEGEYDIQELIDSEVTLTHWTGPEGTRLEQTSLHVDSKEVCAATPTGDLAPYSSEYEGYMGNWGNTLDRWYHRAAVTVWPREQAFANRAEASPAWALEEISAMASAGDVPGARAAAVTLAPFWNTALGGQTPQDRGRTWELFGQALRAADAVADARTAAMLLRPFRVEDLDHESVDPFGIIAGRYGQPWTAELLRTWFGGDRPAWTYGGPERPRWVADRLADLCARLRARGAAGTVTAQRLVDLAWEWLAKDIDTGLASSSPSRRDEKLADLGRPLASLLTAAAVIGSIQLAAGGCACELCRTLRTFLDDTSRRTLEWPLAKERRRHVHARIDAAELPVTHVTRRQGRPYTLVLNKTEALFAGEQLARKRDEADLEWLVANGAGRS